MVLLHVSLENFAFEIHPLIALVYSYYELSLHRNILGLQWNIISFQYYSPKVLGYQFSLQHLLTSVKLPA